MSDKYTRGAQVTVDAEYPHGEEARGLKRIASKGTVACKGGDCRPDTKCEGTALFLASADTKPSKKKGGWRADTVKVCTTWLVGEVIPAPAPEVTEEAPKAAKEKRGVRGKAKVGAKVGAKGKTRSREVESSVEAAPAPSAGFWELLSVAAKTRDIKTVVALARSTKAENEVLVSRLLQAQERLIALQGEQLCAR